MRLFFSLFHLHEVAAVRPVDSAGFDGRAARLRFVWALLERAGSRPLCDVVEDAGQPDGLVLVNVAVDMFVGAWILTGVLPMTLVGLGR